MTRNNEIMFELGLAGGYFAQAVRRGPILTEVQLFDKNDTMSRCVEYDGVPSEQEFQQLARSLHDRVAHP